MKVSDLMRLLKAIGIDYNNDVKTRKLHFRTNAITPNRLCDVVAVYSENGIIDDILGEPILQDELDKIIAEEEKNKKQKPKMEIKIEEIVELIMIEAESDSGYIISKNDWMKAGERKICQELCELGDIFLFKEDFNNFHYKTTV